jgi:hypothetical protein
MTEYANGFRIRRNADGTLPHIMPGQPARSMYADGSTIDDFDARIEALNSAAFARINIRTTVVHVGEEPRDPIRVDAWVGRPVREIDDAEPWTPEP